MPAPPDVPSHGPAVSVVVPTRDTRELTLACLAAVASFAPAALETVVVDDAGGDGTAEAVARLHPGFRLLRSPAPGGFSGAANRGAAACRGEVLLFLNSDTEPPADTVRRVQEAFTSSPRLGIAGARLVYPDGTPQWSGGRRPSRLWLFAFASGLPPRLARMPGYRRWWPVSGERGGGLAWVTAAALAVRRATWEEAGPFATAYRHYGQDLELCLRARDRGWAVRLLPAWRVMHHHGGTVGSHSAASPLLWGDLVRWAGRERGPGGAVAAARLLRSGAVIGRLVGDVAHRRTLPTARAAVREALAEQRRERVGE